MLGLLLLMVRLTVPLLLLLLLLQVFSPSGTGPDEKGVYKEKEVAAVHYSADKMDPHGR